MAGILMILTVLLFSLFFGLGIVSLFQKSRGKWIYLTLSVITFFTLVFMLFFLDWNISDPWNKNPDSPPTETPKTNVGGAGYPYSIQWTIDTIDW